MSGSASKSRPTGAVVDAFETRPHTRPVGETRAAHARARSGEMLEPVPELAQQAAGNGRGG